ncbi:recombinase family protein [Arenimonas sp.]|uniref:recombinase family protein n=1 Tax=Arenimonas sp. TaxID=1872635 RepID=UPI0025F035D3|nr:recombinase family protein [Arenimonas sp.]
MIVGYARVSTHDQNPGLQLDALRAAGCDQVFHEKATGANRERPELAACLRTLRTGDTLVVWKLDRLARSLKDLVEIIEGLQGKGVGFRSLTEAIDTTSTGGRLVFHIFGALAEFEHSLIRERTMAGLAAARARGRKGGRKPAMSAADVRKAAAMLSDPAITKTEVAKHFSVTRVTLNAALARGGYHSGKDINSDAPHTEENNESV